MLGFWFGIPTHLNTKRLYIANKSDMKMAFTSLHNTSLIEDSTISVGLVSMMSVPVKPDILNMLHFRL